MRLAAIVIALLAAVVAFTPAGVAEAKSKKKAKPVPTVTRVSPMRVRVGKRITIRGKNFSSSKRSNTIFFRSHSKRVAFAKPSSASSRKLVVKVPASVERLLLTKSGTRPAARFTMRVVTKRYGKLTSKRLSPVIVSAIALGKPVAAHCGTGSDWDGDGLTNVRENQLKTDPCLKDTDGDGAEDAFEVESALDLNQRAVPYPAKRPFPNALYPDGGNDYDGDGLSNAEESAAWAHPAQAPGANALQAYTGSLRAPAFAGPYGGVPHFGNHAFPMNYSDGNQRTVPTAEYQGYLDLDGDGVLTDDERDADGDGLRNIDEIRSLMWEGHYPTSDDCGYVYKPVLPRTFAQVNWLDSDTDGDGVWDGNDDQDNDGVSNVNEVQPPFGVCDKASPLPIDGARDGQPAKRDPYNPCLPDPRSATCARYGLRQ